MKKSPQAWPEFDLPDQQREEMELRLKKYFSPNKEPDVKNANTFTSWVIWYVKGKGGSARRVNVFGRLLKSTPKGWSKDMLDAYEILRLAGYTVGKMIPSGMLPGYEDLDVCLKGLKIAIEVKWKKDSQTPEQQKRQKELEASGGIYLIAKTKKQIKDEIDKII